MSMKVFNHQVFEMERNREEMKARMKPKMVNIPDFAYL